jgi:hypothetical protein
MGVQRIAVSGKALDVWDATPRGIAQKERVHGH